MSTLTLVRHGQARPFEKDSDRLSDLGFVQAAALGEYWVQKNIAFDQAIRGSLTRHLQTAEAAGFEEAEIDPGWDEYDAGAILQHLGPMLAKADAAFAQRKSAFDALPANSTDRNRYFQKMLESLMDAWLAGRVTAPGVETFDAYRERVLAALRRVVDGEGSNRNVVVFTSGGPIGLCVQSTLRAPDAAFLELNWRVRNCALTEFTFSKGRISLDSLNVLSHLERESWTWR